METFLKGLGVMAVFTAVITLYLLIWSDISRPTLMRIEVTCIITFVLIKFIVSFLEETDRI